MNNFKRVSAAALAGATLALASGASHGMGFGRPVSRAVLGEPLRVSVPLRLDSGESLSAECLAVEVYFGEDRLAAGKVQVSLVAGNGRDASVQLRTNVPISEPVVTYLLTAGCQAKVSRQFVDFADPPGMPIAPLRVSTPVTTAEPTDKAEASGRVDGVLQVASPQVPTPAPVSASPRRRETPDRAPQTSARAAKKAPVVREARAADTAPSPRTSLSLNPKAPAPAPDGRLELDPVEVDAAARPDLRMSGELSGAMPSDEPATPEVQARRAAAAALWQAMNLSPEEVARDRQKLLAQERVLTQIQAQASQASAAARLAGQPGDSVPERSGLLYFVGALAVAGVGLCAALFVQLRRRKQAEAAWWQSQMQEPVTELAGGAADAKADASESAAPIPMVAQTAPAVAAVPAAPAPKSDVEQVVSRQSQGTRASAPAAAEAMREVSVEELIDLEQQAEFFVVLGQDDAAVDLLESHVHAVAASPLPFLKLLEIYQRLGKRADYERVQQAFNARFNAHAPAWEADLQHGHELSDYPGVVERLQALWSSPTQAMAVLERSLTRPESEADTFELPAYRELLFLYAVARDLAERDVEDRPTVDLVSSATSDHPIDTVPFDLVHHDSAVEPLMATRPVKAMPDAQPTLSLDLQLDDLVADVKPQSSYGDVVVVGKAAANEQEVEHIDLPGLSETDQGGRAAHKP